MGFESESGDVQEELNSTTMFVRALSRFRGRNPLALLELQGKRTVSTATTVNADEIAHFSSLSEHWWDEQGEFKMLHRMNPVRVQFIRDRVVRARHDEGIPDATDLRGLDALDIGCGGGLLSEVSRLQTNLPALND